jgi:hypothetical protein
MSVFLKSPVPQAVSRVEEGGILEKGGFVLFAYSVCKEIKNSKVGFGSSCSACGCGRTVL